MRLFIFILLIFAAFCSAQNPNLIINSDFELSKAGELRHWSGVDGLTVQYLKKGGNPGACVVFDTAVQQSDKKKHQENPEAFQGKKQGNQYATVGAHEGVWIFSQPVDINKGDEYFILSVDVKADKVSIPMIMIRGFVKVSNRDAGKNNSIFHVPHKGGPAYSEQFGPEKQRRDSRVGDYLMVWRMSMFCRIDEPDKWEHFEMGITLPKQRKFRPERIWLKPYAYWPLGKYYFDNVKLRRATAQEVKEVNSKRKSVND